MVTRPGSINIASNQLIVAGLSRGFITGLTAPDVYIEVTPICFIKEYITLLTLLLMYGREVIQ